MEKLLEEKFIGVLFCGGRGVRLGEITRYISKSFVPVYDRPVFKYGLELLENSRYIDEIIILTNDDNDRKLKLTGHKTIIQDDDVVFDMFSGWRYIKQLTGTQKHGVLVPSDNITDIDVDKMVERFNQKPAQLLFSLYKVPEREKLAQMGCYSVEKKTFYYKHPDPPTEYGVIAPYLVNRNLEVKAGDNVLNHPDSVYYEHAGYWFDIGDQASIIEASSFMMNLNRNKEVSHDRR
jgi:NDP-sugar pyrophosphorylase family protein